MAAKTNRDIYAIVWRLPLIVWQMLFFVVPLGFMFVMSFWLVKNYRMVPAFALDNWTKILSWGIFWNAYGLTFALATGATILGTLLAFPAAYGLAFKVNDATRRWAISFLSSRSLPATWSAFMPGRWSWRAMVSSTRHLAG